MGFARGLIACHSFAFAFVLALACEGRRPLVADISAADVGGRGGEAGAAGEGGEQGSGRSGSAGGAGGEAGGKSCSAPLCDGASCGPGKGTCKAPIRLGGPNPLEGGWRDLVIAGDTRCGKSEHLGQDCAAAGSELVFELDLSEVPSGVVVRGVLDAAFDGSLHIERGQCEDPVVVACNEDHADGVDRAVVSATLEPDHYRLVVDAEREGEGGEFSLSLLLRAEDAQCAESPENDGCDGAIDLDPDLPVQTVVGSTRCAHNDAYSFFECHLDDTTPDVFYRLDLSARDEPVVVRASTDIAPTDFDTILYVMDSAQGHCFAALACNDDGPSQEQRLPGSSELVTRLEPGQYFLVVDGVDGAGDFGLRVSLNEVECAANVSCEDALDLDASEGESSYTVDTVCATSSLVTRCSAYGNGPDVYYRLDLSAYAGPVRVRAAMPDSYGWSLALLPSAGEASCGSQRLCSGDSLEAVLEPGVYYIAVSAPRNAERSGELALELEAVAADQLVDCVDTAVADCAEDLLSAGDTSCCDEPTGSCLYAWSSCGLDPGLRACVCDAAPECCEPFSSGPDCAAVFATCGLLCPSFDFSAYCEQKQ